MVLARSITTLAAASQAFAAQAGSFEEVGDTVVSAMMVSLSAV
jgi:hypothetical protein